MTFTKELLQIVSLIEAGDFETLRSIDPTISEEPGVQVALNEDGFLKTNMLYWGDNYRVLSQIPDESVDLIYLDPPFMSDRDYTFGGGKNKIVAFNDTWRENKTVDKCRHNPENLFAWHAFNYRTGKNDILCVGCCKCGDVLEGGVDSL